MGCLRGETTPASALRIAAAGFPPRSISSEGASLVISRVCGSSVGQQVASLSTTCRNRGASEVRLSRNHLVGQAVG